MNSQGNTIDFLSQLLRRTVDDFMEVISRHTESSQNQQARSERELELRARFYLEVQLVPSILAIACGLYQLHFGQDIDASILNQKVPELIKRFMYAPLHAEAEFLEHISKLVDPGRLEALAALGPDTRLETLAVQAFDATLTDIFSEHLAN